MTADPLAPELERIKAETAAEATRVVSRFWLGQALRISEATTDPEARWDLLLTALRKVSWPD